MSAQLQRLLERDARVIDVSCEGEDGYWIYFAPGWMCPLSGVHCCHEATVAEVLRAFRGIQPCDCDECRREQEVK